MIGRRHFARLAGSGLLVAGCKRQRAPEVAETWDEQPAVEQTEALGNLAPPWPAPVRGRLTNGLVSFWLHETGSPALHVRALLPTVGPDGDDVGADAVAVITDHISFELQRRLGREGVTVRIDHGPDRVEIGLHGAGRDLGRIFKWLGWALRPAAPLAGLTRARDRLAQQLPPAGTQDAAIAHLVATMLGRPATHDLVDATRLGALSRSDLEQAWATLTDPRRAVMVVHSGEPAAAGRAVQRSLGTAWHGLGKLDTPEEAVARLHLRVKADRSPHRLLADPAAPLSVLDAGRGEPTLVVGRVIPTESAPARSRARLAQRLLQEEIDARLIVSGEHALLVVRAPLSRSTPERSAQDLVDAIADFAGARQPSQRLFTAAQLWLGARVVEASLQGEDWTGLFAEAIDLADRDADIATALARDATSMLEPDADAMQTWQRKWLDPRAGEVGWHWLAAGVERKTHRRLERITQLAPIA